MHTAPSWGVRITTLALNAWMTDPSCPIDTCVTQPYKPSSARMLEPTQNHHSKCQRLIAGDGQRDFNSVGSCDFDKKLTDGADACSGLDRGSRLRIRSPPGQLGEVNDYLQRSKPAFTSVERNRRTTKQKRQTWRESLEPGKQLRRAPCQGKRWQVNLSLNHGVKLFQH